MGSVEGQGPNRRNDGRTRDLTLSEVTGVDRQLVQEATAIEHQLDAISDATERGDEVLEQSLTDGLIAFVWDPERYAGWAETELAGAWGDR